MSESETDRQNDETIANLLRHFQPPAADPRFVEQAVSRARHEAERRRQSDGRKSHAVLTGFGVAVVAGLALLAVGNLFFGTPKEALPGEPVPELTIALAGDKTVNLVFSSAEALDEARISLLLPPGVELEGFPGQRQVAWDTSLEQGKNLLPLTFIATSAEGGEIVATLEHDARGRTYRLRVDIV